MAREIPYIDTKVAVERTVSEIEVLLQMHHAEAVIKEFEAGRIKNLAFKHQGIPFRLPARVDALYQYLLSKRNRTRFVYDDDRERIFAQAERTAWRNVMYWVKGQLAMVEIGMVEVREVFLPYMLMDGRSTLYDHMLERGFNMLPEGRDQ